MKLGTANLTETQPFTHPQTPPIKTAKGKATITANSQSSIATPNIALENAITEPTERSIPAVMMTKVIPTEITAKAGT